jgi:nitrate reductase NapAB chaperone NapD
MHMPIASAVVDIKDGSCEAVLGRLARIPRISVYGVKENQIVTVIEGPTINDVDATVKEVSMLDEVIGIYPVFVGEDD